VIRSYAERLNNNDLKESNSHVNYRTHV